MATRKSDAFLSPTPPTGYQSAKSEPSEPDGVVSKTQTAIARTGKVIGMGVLLVGVFGLKLLLDDEDEDEYGFDPDPLWRQGYGFNNPNNERIKNGEPVLNFDGSVAD